MLAKAECEAIWKTAKETNKPVVDDITVKNTVLDSINAKLQRIDHTLINMNINQGKTIREAELEKQLQNLEETLLDWMPGMVTKYCGGSNSYESTKLGCEAHGELTATIRTNKQEISNGNQNIEQYGYMFGKWIIKKTCTNFCIGLYKALKEGG